MTISSSNFNTMNDKNIRSGKKKKSKKTKKKKSIAGLDAYQEQITDRSFIMSDKDWNESTDDLSFDDVQTMVNNEVTKTYKNTGAMYGQRYYIYKLWPDKVVLKRSYDNKDTNDDLFIMMSYDIFGDDVVLGDAIPVNLGFVPQTFQSDEFMMAMREADALSIDDPEFAKRVVEREHENDDADEDVGDDDEDEEDEDEDADEDVGDDSENEEDGEDGQDASAGIRESELREDVGGAKIQDISESFGFNAIDKTTSIVEAADGSYIIKGMSLLGPKSKNNRSYSKDVRKNAIKVFEGIRAYCNHPAKGKEDETRMVQELIGRHKNVRFDETTDMLRSDLHLSPTETVKKFIIPHAKTNPEIIGNSINASGKLSNDGTIVMEITNGRSVDIVSDPATTNGLYESVISNKPLTREGGDGNMEITKDSVLKEAKLVEELRAHFREEFDVEYSVESISEENEELKTKLKEYEVKESIAAIQVEVDGLLKTSKLPEDVKNDKDLRAILESAEGVDARKTIIARFEKVAESAMKAAKVGGTGNNGKAPSLESIKEGVEDTTKLQESALVSRLASALTARR